MKPTLVRITKQFTFDMAHALYGYDGPCRNIHGHTYSLSVTLRGRILQLPDHPKNGMLIDFTDFKNTVNSAILKPFDHALVLNGESPHKNTVSEHHFEKILYVSYQPTCENMLLDFRDRLEGQFPDHCEIVGMRLDETPTSYAEWRIEDHPITNAS